MPNNKSKTAKRRGGYKKFSHPWSIDTEPEHDVSTADSSSLGSDYDILERSELRPNESTNNFNDQQIQHIQSLVDQLMKQMSTALNDALNLILKGVPSEINTTYILDDLKLKGFSVTKIYRLKSDSDLPIDEVAFQLPKEEDHILSVCCCLGFPVTVEKYNDDFSQVEACSVLNQKFKKYSMDPINILIRAVPVDILENDVVEDLKRKHFQPIAVHRMVKYLPRGERRPLPMLLVQVHREESYIYKLKCLLGFDVTVEKFFSHLYTITQCTECRQFGHDDSYCPDKKAKAVKPYFVLQDITSVLNVVIPVPLQYEDDEFVMTHLENNGFNPVAIKRMVAGPTTLPFYLVQIPHSEKRIMQWSCCLGFWVKIANYMPDQCEYCHQFDHTEQTCHVKDEDGFQRPRKRRLGFKESTQKLKENCWKKLEKKIPEANKNIYSEDDISEVESQAAVYTTKPKEMKNASTNTTVYAPLNTMTQNFKTYANIMGQFKTKLGSFAKSMDEYHIDTSNLAPFVSSFENLFDLHGTTLPILDAMICVMKSINGLIMDMPDLPGVTSHTLNEQLHTLEKLEELKVMNRTYLSRFTAQYDEQFPKL